MSFTDDKGRELRHFIIADEGRVVEASHNEWVSWSMKAGGPVTIAEDRVGETLIVTIFLGYCWTRPGADPKPYRTFVNRGKYDGYREHTETRKEALRAHRAMIMLQA